MSTGSVPLFRSSATPGFSSLVSSDPRRIVARKLVREIDVIFADAPCVVRTNEGVVYAPCRRCHHHRYRGGALARLAHTLCGKIPAGAANR